MGPSHMNLHIGMPSAAKRRKVAPRLSLEQVIAYIRSKRYDHQVEQRLIQEASQTPSGAYSVYMKRVQARAMEITKNEL